MVLIAFLNAQPREACELSCNKIQSNLTTVAKIQLQYKSSAIVTGRGQDTNCTITTYIKGKQFHTFDGNCRKNMKGLSFPFRRPKKAVMNLNFVQPQANDTCDTCMMTLDY